MVISPWGSKCLSTHVLTVNVTPMTGSTSHKNRLKNEFCGQSDNFRQQTPGVSTFTFFIAVLLQRLLWTRPVGFTGVLKATSWVRYGLENG